MVKLRGRGDSSISGLSPRIFSEDFFYVIEDTVRCVKQVKLLLLQFVWGQVTKCLDYEDVLNTYSRPAIKQFSDDGMCANRRKQ